MLTLLLIIVIFTSLVLAHEWGHFVVARHRGVKAEEFGVGFPPRLLSRKVRGTLYSLNLLPLGGFVRLKGENGESTAADSFVKASLSTKTLILLAGVTMNVIVAFILLVGLCWAGLPGIGSFEPGFLPRHYSESPRLLVTDVTAGSPADGIGLKDGDYIIKADGQPQATDDQFFNFTKGHAGQVVELTVTEAGQTVDRSVHLKPPSVKQGFLGVGTQAVYRLKYNWWQGIIAAAWITGKLFLLTIWAVILLIVHLPALVGGLFTHQVPTAVSAAAGPVGIFVILKTLATLGPGYVLLFAANISVALAAFNVMPLPALDGGRLALILVQRLFHRRLRNTTEALIHNLGFLALIALVIIITIYDVRRFL